jgi:hypothetical protein
MQAFASLRAPWCNLTCHNQLASIVSGAAHRRRHRYRVVERTRYRDVGFSNTAVGISAYSRMVGCGLHTAQYVCNETAYHRPQHVAAGSVQANLVAPSSTRRVPVGLALAIRVVLLPLPKVRRPTRSTPPGQSVTTGSAIPSPPTVVRGLPRRTAMRDQRLLTRPQSRTHETTPAPGGNSLYTGLPVGAGVWQTFWLAQTGGPGVPGRRCRHQTHQPDPHDSPRPGCIAARPTGQRPVDLAPHQSPPPSARSAENLTLPRNAPIGEPLNTPRSRSTSTGSLEVVHKSAIAATVDPGPFVRRSSWRRWRSASSRRGPRAEVGGRNAGLGGRRSEMGQPARGKRETEPATHAAAAPRRDARARRTAHRDPRLLTTQQPPHNRGLLLIAQRQAGNESERFAEPGGGVVTGDRPHVVTGIAGRPARRSIVRRPLSPVSATASRESAE